MRAFLLSLRLLALLALVAASGAALLDGHIALTVALGSTAGALLAVPKYGPTLAAILLSPFALVSLFLSALSWPAEGQITALLSAVGPLLLVSLLPYAAARLSRRGLLVAFAAWVAAVQLTLFAAQWIATGMVEQNDNPMLSAEENAQVALSTAGLWSTYNNSRQVAHMSYRGHLDMPACDGLYTYRYVASIPASARRTVEHFTDVPLPQSLGGASPRIDSSDLQVPCTTRVEEMSDGLVRLHGSCAPPAWIRRYVTQYPSNRSGFDVRLPTVQLQAPFIVPGRGSRLTVSAPAYCIAATFPAAASTEAGAGTERLTLNVGFPRAPSADDAVQLGTLPYVVHVQLLEPDRRNWTYAVPVRMLNGKPGSRLLFIASAIAAALLGWPAYRWLLGRMLRIRILAAAHRTASRRSERLTPRLRLALRIGFAGLLALLLLPLLLIAWDLAALGTIYGHPLLLAGGALCLIEVLALAIRRTFPKAAIAQSADDGEREPAEQTEPVSEVVPSPAAHRSKRWNLRAKRAIVIAGLILAAALVYARQQDHRPAPPMAPAPPVRPRPPASAFLMPVEDSAAAAGRVTRVTGRIEAGTVRAGDEIDIVGLGPNRTARVTGVEISGGIARAPGPGDDVGLLLGSIGGDPIRRGQVLARPGSISACTHFDATLTPLPGRSGRNVRLHIRTADLAATIEFPNGRTLSEGRLFAQVHLAAAVAISDGLAFRISERGRTLGSGRVLACHEALAAGPGVRARVFWLVAERLGVDPQRVTMNARFAEDLHANELDFGFLMLGLDVEFGLSMPDDAAERFRTVGDVVRYIERSGQ